MNSIKSDYKNKKISIEELKKTTRPKFEESRLIYKAVNSNFFYIKGTIKETNEKIQKFEEKSNIFKNMTGYKLKMEIKNNNNLIAEKIISNYELKEKLNKINKNNSVKNKKFDNQKNLEILGAIKEINKGYLNKKNQEKIKIIVNNLEKSTSKTLVKTTEKGIQGTHFIYYKALKEFDIK